MAICDDCNREMTEAASCTVEAVRINDGIYRRWRWRSRKGWRCGDCGVQPGGWHHLGCDMERCPVCRGQLICCNCPAEDNEHGPLIRPVLSHTRPA
jgi:hypothetical protein